jgi:hypothetical protein
MSFQTTGTVTAFDAFTLGPASGYDICIHSVAIGQKSEITEAQEEMLGFQIIRGYTASGTGGSTTGRAVPVKNDPNDSVGQHLTTARITDVTTVASTGTPVYLWEDTWNVRIGYQYRPTPEERIYCTSGDGLLIVRIPDIPADAIDFRGVICFEELN